MKTIYVVMWCLAFYNWSSTEPKYDEFGRTSEQSELSMKLDCNYHSKEFINRDSAIVFYNRIKKHESSHEDAEQQLNWNMTSWQSFEPIINVAFDSIIY